MKHPLIILISILLLSSPVIGNSHKGETLYLWKNHSGDGFVWKGFGDKDTHTVYKGEVDESGKPNPLGSPFFISNSFPNIRKGITPPIKSFTFVTIPNHRRRQKKEGEDDE